MSVRTMTRVENPVEPATGAVATCQGIRPVGRASIGGEMHQIGTSDPIYPPWIRVGRRGSLADRRPVAEVGRDAVFRVMRHTSGRQESLSVLQIGTASDRPGEPT